MMLLPAGKTSRWMFLQKYQVENLDFNGGKYMNVIWECMLKWKDKGMKRNIDMKIKRYKYKDTKRQQKDIWAGELNKGAVNSEVKATTLVKRRDWKPQTNTKPFQNIINRVFQIHKYANTQKHFYQSFSRYHRQGG